MRFPVQNKFLLPLQTNMSNLLSYSKLINNIIADKLAERRCQADEMGTQDCRNNLTSTKIQLYYVGTSSNLTMD